MKNLFYGNKFCRISSLWLIVFTIVAMLASCSPSAVRNSYSKSKLPASTAPQKERTIEDKLKEFESKAISAKESESPKVEQERRLLTLREQVQSLSDEQVVINSKISSMQGDIEEIRYTLEEIKTALQQNSTISRKGAVAGLPTDAQENRLSRDSGTLLSDEADDTPYLQRQVKKAEKSKAAPAKPQPSVSKPAATKPAAKADSQKQVEAAPAEPEQKGELSEAINLFSQKQHSRSIEELNQIVSSTGNVALKLEAYYWLAENLMALGNYSQAINNYNHVVSSKASDKKDVATAKMAECLLKMGQTSEAKDTYKQLIEKFPKSEYVPKARKLLQQI